VEGRVTTALPEVATVCNGSQLELNCTITGSVLEWRFIPEQNHSQLSTLTHYPTINLSFQYGDSTISFTIISHPMELTSYITVISPVTNTLNDTVVECTDVEDRESPTSTVINVVNDQGKSKNYIPCLQG
jgi:desulfoferrodoxin (superoxide reductase-like protein)